LFVLRADDRNFWHKDIGSQRVNLQLYCQAPGKWHPTIDLDDPTKKTGLYAIDTPDKWLEVMAPHISRMVKVLKYASPLVSPILGVKVPDLDAQVKADVGLMNSLVTKLPDITNSPEFKLTGSNPNDDIEAGRLAGSALRALRQFLEEKDSQQHWGGLRRVLTPEGDYLWLCEHHAAEYA
jgi:hypothetical protein